MAGNIKHYPMKELSLYAFPRQAGHKKRRPASPETR
jgi:hypothetical protein